jgi:hypothetical protein
MEKLKISEIELTITNAQERLRMGGPFTGDVFIDNKLISVDCLLNNFVYKEDSNLLFFVKYHRINNYQYFTINFYQLDNDVVYEFYKEFDIIHITQFLSTNELEIFLAFHDKSMDKRQIFYFDDEDFRQI